LKCYNVLGDLEKKDVFSDYNLEKEFRKFKKGIAKCNLNMDTFTQEVMAGVNGVDDYLSDSGTESIP
jgi:hypothetical protein